MTLDKVESWCEEKGWDTEYDRDGQDLTCHIETEDGQQVGEVNVRRYKPLREHGESAVKEAKEAGIDPDIETFDIRVNIESDGLNLTTSVGPVPASALELDQEDPHLGHIPLEGVPLQVEEHGDRFVSYISLKDGQVEETRDMIRDAQQERDSQRRRRRR